MVLIQQDKPDMQDRQDRQDKQDRRGAQRSPGAVGRRQELEAAGERCASGSIQWCQRFQRFRCRARASGGAHVRGAMFRWGWGPRWTRTWTWKRGWACAWAWAWASHSAVCTRLVVVAMLGQALLVLDHKWRQCDPARLLELLYSVRSTYSTLPM